ncbi:RadC family protein [Butyrivibrio sp. MB2005]|uniref:RadC family protein n=1 Tax=Butyrivibrio sp. MB2005 TaxID=1280678 RepID=UPI000422CA7D|nr:DNA repair protein RadC [Butyrivibrio sp. MB2005]
MEQNKTKNRLMENESYKETLPYERFSRFGAEALTDAELLAIILRTGTSTLTPTQMGALLLKKGEKYSEGLSGIHYLSLDEIKSVPGIGDVKAIKIKCIAELSNRIARCRSLQLLEFKSPAMIADYYMESMCHKDKEHVIVAFFNHQMAFIGDEVISVGTVKNASVSPREIFLSALKNKAVYIVLLHNHPSGDPIPSSADDEMTRQIYEAGSMLDIKLQDHIIIGDHRYYSYLEQHLLENI